MDDLICLSYILGLPLVLMAVVAAFGWRYRKVVAESMAKSGLASAATPAVAAPHTSAPAAAPAAGPLRIERIERHHSDVINGPAAQALERAKATTHAANRCFLIAGSMFWSVVVALLVWTVPLSWNKIVLPFVALFAALPGLVVLTSVVARSWRTWAIAAVAYFALAIAMVLAVGWYLAAFAKVGAAALTLAGLYALPGLAALLLIQRGLRTLLIGLVPVLLYLVAGVAFAGMLGLSGDLEELAQRPELRWPGWAMFAIGAAVVPASVWAFLRLLRSGTKARFVAIPVLAIVAVAGIALDEVLHPDFPLGPLLAALPGVILQCFIVWLLFKGIVVFEATHWLPSQALHVHLCWLYLALFSLALFDAQLVDMSPADRRAVYGLFGASFMGYFLLLHVLLRRAWRARSGVPPKRLLFLRVFGAAGQRERLLDTLDDTWRRVGRVDLIGGTDLAIRTLRSMTLECFLLRRTDAEFLTTEADVDQRLDLLRDQLEGDLRYPVNDIYCYADAWQAAVMKLAPASNVVLLDLRGFTKENEGCKFELTNLVWHIPLTRVVVLADSTTDEKALDDVAHAAWAALPRESPNASTVAPRLKVLQLGRSSQIASVPLVLFQTAYQHTA